MLQAKTREIRGRKTYQLREEGLVPAVVYGAGMEPQMLTIDRNEFVRLYRELGESSIFELKIDEKESVSVLIQDYQLDPLHDFVIHVDFRAIDMSKSMEVDVELDFVGESAAVKALGGTLVRPRESVTVRCLPTNLPSSLEVDLTKIETFDDTFKVKDLVLPEGVEVANDPERTLAVVAPPRTEEEVAELDGAVEGDVSEVEGAEEEKKDEGAEETKE